MLGRLQLDGDLVAVHSTAEIMSVPAACRLPARSDFHCFLCWITSCRAQCVYYQQRGSIFAVSCVKRILRPNLKL